MERGDLKRNRRVRREGGGNYLIHSSLIAPDGARGHISRKLPERRSREESPDSQRGNLTFEAEYVLYSSRATNVGGNPWGKRKH